MLSIGFIKRRLKGSSLVEVLIAMLISLICFTIFVSFFLQFNSVDSTKIKIEEQYHSDIVWFNAHFPGVAYEKPDVASFQVSENSEKVDSVTLLTIEVVYKALEDTLMFEHYLDNNK